METREIMTKRPWVKASPVETKALESEYTRANLPNITRDDMKWQVRFQSDFLREYYPSGHRINDRMYYPDIYREELEDVLDESGEPTGEKKRNYYVEYVPRFTFAFQQLIATKHLVHLCGNDIQFELTSTTRDQKILDTFTKFREGWLTKDMEIATYEVAKSVEITGDGATICFINNGKFGWTTRSYKDGYTLYPHYDTNGDLEVFACRYYGYDDEGDVSTEYLEMWDKQNYYKLKATGQKYKGVIDKIKDLFGLDGFSIVESKPHGFKEVPVAYHRDEDGAGWSASQDSIDQYEKSFSQMAQNNHAFGEPIMCFQGENIEANHGFDGSVKYITMGSDDKVSYLEGQSAADSYMKQLEKLYSLIFTQSFIVEPPQLKSGDLPAAALKILYSPAVEKAMNQANDYQPYLNVLVRLFAYGYGLETQNTLDFANLPMKWWIKPYVHVNTTSLVTELATAVQNKFLSKQTASERLSEYAVVGEIDRIMREYKEEQQYDILSELAKNTDNTDDNTDDDDKNENNTNE